MLQGTVKWINKATGFGCIAPDDGVVDVFVSLAALPIQLKEGQKVSFQLFENGSIKPTINVAHAQ